MAKKNKTRNKTNNKTNNKTKNNPNNTAKTMANPTNPESASLATLPTELIATIIEHALPDDIPSTYHAHLGPYSSHIPLCLLEDRWRRQKARMPKNQYAVVYVNKRFNAEAVRILQSRQFRIEIDEMSFHEVPERQADKDWWYEMCGPLTGYERRWSWNKTFPNLDLGKIEELVIDIAPSSVGSFWCSARNAVSSLCEKQLEPRGPIRKLIIQVQDMKRSKIWCEMAWCLGDVLEISGKGIDPEDFEDVLMRFEDVVSAAKECEIRLPYWMERDEEMKGRILKTLGGLGATVVFVPLVDAGWEGSRSAEEKVRRGLHLVHLDLEHVSFD